MKLLIAILFASGCAVDLPRCAELGCPIAPSGSAEAWEPCVDATCWCGAPVAQECEP